MFDWDRDFEEVTAARCLANRAASTAIAAPNRGRIRRALMTVGLPLVMVGALFTAPTFAPASSDAVFGAFGLSHLTLEPAMPTGLLSYDQAQFDNFRQGIARFTDSELLAHAAASRRDAVNPRLTMADWDLDALRLTELEIARRGLRMPVSVSVSAPRRSPRPAPASAI